MADIIVLIPHYNNSHELAKSLMSIDEEQTVDVLIIDDGSKCSPNLDEIREHYKNGKVLLDILDKNQGIENALNRGLDIIKKLDYKYIGRLDCGDYCIKNRFTKQIEYLENNKEIYLLGTWANIKNNNGDLLYVLKHPTSYDEIKKKMFINNMFVHPSVVFRKKTLEKIEGYPTNYEAAEDYAFFFKIVLKFKAENLPEPLLDYILDSNSISSKKRFIQVKSRIRIIVDNFRLGFFPIYGLTRNCFLLFLPRNFTTRIKKLISKN